MKTPKYKAIPTTVDNIRFASKICPWCKTIFYRNGRQTSHWNKQKHCSFECGRAARVIDPVIRFWQKVNKTINYPCWEWTAGKLDFGYGGFRADMLGLKRMEKAHRVAFFLANGRLPPSPKVVRHSCDNPGCVNPEHLLEGTHKDNCHDMFSRGRANPPRGSAHTNAKLTQRKIVHAMRLRNDGRTLKFIAARYGVHLSTIHKALRGETWNE